jgi:hypothetical protein
MMTVGGAPIRLHNGRCSEARQWAILDEPQALGAHSARG